MLKRIEGVRASKGTGRYVRVGTPLIQNMAMAGVSVFTITNYGDVISQPSEGHMPIVCGHRYEEPLFNDVLSGHYRIEVDSRGRAKNWYRILKSERWPQRAYNVKQWGDDYKRKMTDGYKIALADPQGRRRVSVEYLDGNSELEEVGYSIEESLTNNFIRKSVRKYTNYTLRGHEKVPLYVAQKLGDIMSSQKIRERLLVR